MAQPTLALPYRDEAGFNNSPNQPRITESVRPDPNAAFRARAEQMTAQARAGSVKTAQGTINAFRNVGSGIYDGAKAAINNPLTRQAAGQALRYAPIVGGAIDLKNAGDSFSDGDMGGGVRNLGLAASNGLWGGLGRLAAGALDYGLDSATTALAGNPNTPMPLDMGEVNKMRAQTGRAPLSAPGQLASPKTGQPTTAADAEGAAVGAGGKKPEVSSLQKAMSAVDRQSDALSKSLASEGTTQAKSGLGAYGMGGGMDSQSFQDRVGLAMAKRSLGAEQAFAKLGIDADKAQYDMKKDSADRIGKFNLFTTTDGDGKVVEDLEANNQAKRAAMEAGIGGIVDPEQQQGAMVNAALHNQLTRNAASVDEKLRDTSGGLRLAKGPQGQGATFADYFQSGSDDIGVFDALLGRETVRIEDGKGGTRAVTTKSLGKNAAGGQDPTTNAYLRALMAKSQQGV